MYQRIVVPIDGSEPSTEATTAALQLARESGARVHFVHVLDEVAYYSGYDYTGQMMAAARSYARKILDDALSRAHGADVTADAVLVEAPGGRLGDEIAKQARVWEADLVVIGTHGRHGISRLLLGSGAEQVLRIAPVPVLAVRAPAPWIPF